MPMPIMLRSKSLYAWLVGFGNLIVLATWYVAGALGHAQPAGWGPLTSTGRTAPATWPTRPPARIYVVPFSMQPGLQEQLEQQASASPIPQGPVRQFLSQRPRAADMVTGYDRTAPIGASLAKQVADSLAQAGVPVVLWNNPGPPPSDGWRLSGQVVGLDEGNAAAQNMIGFGVGNKTVGVDVSMSDPLTAGGQPFFLLGTSDKGRMVPGTVAVGAVAGFNPYVVVGKLVASNSGIADITQQNRIAGDIAGSVSEGLKAHGQLAR